MNVDELLPPENRANYRVPHVCVSDGAETKLMLKALKASMNNVQMMETYS